MKQKIKKSLSLKDIKRELSAIAQGEYNLGPFQAELRMKTLKNLADILLKEKQAGIESKKAVKPVTISVVNPVTNDQMQRVKSLEESLLATAQKDGEI